MKCSNCGRELKFGTYNHEPAYIPCDCLTEDMGYCDNCHKVDPDDYCNDCDRVDSDDLCSSCDAQHEINALEAKIDRLEAKISEYEAIVHAYTEPQDTEQ